MTRNILKKIKLYRWKRRNNAVRADIFAPENIIIGENTHIAAHATIWADGKKILIGDNCRIEPYAYLRLWGGNIVLGNHVSINPFTVVYGHGGVTIGDCTRIATHCVIIPANHLYADRDTPIYQQGERCQGISIGRDVWIGARSVILDGVTVGDGCVIGAGSVVTRATEPFGVYVGCPARLIKKR